MRYQLVGNRKILADELSVSIIMMEAHNTVIRSLYASVSMGAEALGYIQRISCRTRCATHAIDAHEWQSRFPALAAQE